MINDKSRRSITKLLSFDTLLHYKFIVQFACERISKIGENLAKLQASRSQRRLDTSRRRASPGWMPVRRRTTPTVSPSWSVDVHDDDWAAERRQSNANYLQCAASCNGE